MKENIITKELLIDIIEHFYAAVYIIDEKGNMLYLNRAAEAMDQLEREKVIGKNLAEI